jgi:hypothetical protein
MGSQLTTLTSADIQRFERDGYVVVRQAFSRADGLAMEGQWWRELEGTHGIRRDDCSSWRQIPGDLKAAKRDPLQARILTERVRGVFDDLLGQAAWPPPRDWGRPLVTFPEPGAWDVPARLWHWDNPCDLHLDHPRALFVVSFIGSVAPHGGGTLILSGSPRLLIQQERRIPAKPAARFDRHAKGPVPPLSPLAHGAHGTNAVTCRPDRRLHGQGNHRRRRAPSRGRVDGRAGGHGLLPSRHGPLRRAEPGHAAALHADQDAGSHPRGPRPAEQIATSALVGSVLTSVLPSGSR